MPTDDTTPKFPTSEDTGRVVRLRDITDLRRDLVEQGSSTRNALDDHAKQDHDGFRDVRSEVSELRGETREMRGAIGALATTTAVQHEKLDTILSRTKSRDQADKSTRESQTIEQRNAKEHRRGIIRIILGAFFSGGVVVWLLHHFIG